MLKGAVMQHSFKFSSAYSWGLGFLFKKSKFLGVVKKAFLVLEITMSETNNL